jgi:RNA polymerase sigma-70 factor, ECF subfamily
LSAEIREQLGAALAELPERQRIVVTLRDVEGYASDEVCSILGISAANQRVLLHRARAIVRGRLEEYFEAAVVAEDGASSRAHDQTQQRRERGWRAPARRGA